MLCQLEVQQSTVTAYMGKVHRLTKDEMCYDELQRQVYDLADANSGTDLSVFLREPWLTDPIWGRSKIGTRLIAAYQRTVPGSIDDDLHDFKSGIESAVYVLDSEL